MVESISTSTLIYDVFKPVFILTRACGFLPVRITRNDLNTDIIWSRKYCILSLAGLVLFVSWIIFGLSKTYEIDDVYNIRLKQFSGMFVTILDDTYLIFTFVLGTLITPFTFKHFWRYLTCLNKADDLLKRQQITEKNKCTVVFILTIILTIAVLGIDLTMWAKVIVNHISCFVYLLYNIPFYCTYFLVMVIEINYWYLVDTLNVRLRYLNENLTSIYNQYQLKMANRNVAQQRSKNDGGNNVYVLKDVLDETVKRYKHLYEQSKSIMITSSCYLLLCFFIAAKSGKHAINFVKVYELLFDACSAVNAFYGINILLVIIGCLIHLLVTPYDLYLELKYEDYTFVFPQICWMTSHVLRLLLVVEPCQAAKQEFEIFAIQLLHCPIEFTACNLVVLNRSLLTAIAGGVTTYLVILFQFENH